MQILTTKSISNSPVIAAFEQSHPLRIRLKRDAVLGLKVLPGKATDGVLTAGPMSIDRRIPMTNPTATVLLVGEGAVRSVPIRRWLKTRGCPCESAASFQDACSLMSRNEFDLVLCQYELPDRTAFPLLDWFEGSHSTLVFSTKAGRKSWWVPMIERGERCRDRAPLKSSELPGALEKIFESASGCQVTALPVSH